MKYRRYIFSVIGWILLTNTQVSGNHEKGDSLGLSCNSFSTEKIMVLKTPWLQSANAAALSFLNCGNRVAQARVGYQSESGDFTLYQEADQLNRYGFYTHGYSRIGRWRFYGNFNYYNETGKGVKWVDVMEPYNGNPYTVGDSIGGDYWKEYYRMEGNSTLIISDHFSFGIDLKYKGGVGTKRKDPRPENTITDFEFSPGMIWRSGRLKIGSSLRLESGKEDIEFDAVNDRKYDLFYFRGLGAFSSTTEEDGRYSRTNLLGGGIQFNVAGHSLDNLTSLEFNRSTTDIKRGDTYPLQMVMLDSYAIAASSMFLFNPEGRNINQLKISLADTKMYGQEPVVEPKLEEVSWQWSTAAKYTLYWQKSTSCGISYVYYKVRDPHHFSWGGSLSGKYASDVITYYFVPEFNRQKLELLFLNTTLEKNFLRGKNQLVVSLSGGYRTSPSHSLELVENEKLRQNVMTEFVEHDYDYQLTDLWEAGLQLKYGREVSLPGFPVQFFIETGFRRLSADQSVRNLLQIQAGINF